MTGEVVWCRYPDDINPSPKPRPARILAVFDDDAPQLTVRVAYGTNQRINTMHRGNFATLLIAIPQPVKARAVATTTRSTWSKASTYARMNGAEAKASALGQHDHLQH